MQSTAPVVVADAETDTIEQTLPDLSKELANGLANEAADGSALSPQRYIGAKIGKYEVTELAGNGSMGVVFFATDPFTSHEGAIKLCRNQTGQSQQNANLAHRLFFNEAHTAGALEHDNIVRVIDAGEHDGEPYLVMEALRDATPLSTHCRPDTLLPLEHVVRIGLKCAKALDYAHRRGVIHRDIKPSNILLLPDGTPKVVDFGIAQHTQSDATVVLGAIGSPRYMSPEQLREDDLGGQTDIYSLGAVLFEALTGRPPYTEQNFGALVNAILNARPPALTSLRAGIPRALEQVVKRALEPTLERRYAVCAELASDLARIASVPNMGTQIDDARRFELARRLPFFNDFSAADLWEVIHTAEWLPPEGGDTILDEGAVDNAFFVLVAGSVEVSKRGQSIARLEQGDCFGEMGYLAKAARSATIQAIDDCVLVKIESLMMESTSVMCQLRFNRVFLQTLVTRLARTSEDLSKANAIS
jgi:serine/threonine protein kinase